MSFDAAGINAQEAQAIRESLVPGGSAGPTPVSLAAGDRQARRRLPALKVRWEQLVTGLRGEIGREFRGPCHLSVDPLSLGGPMVMGEEVGQWLMGGVLRHVDGTPLVWLGVTPRLGFHLIEMAFGAPNDPSPEVPSRRHLTTVEQQTLWPFLSRIADQVKRHLGFDALGQVTFEALGFAPKLMGLHTEESGIVSHVRFPLGTYEAQIGFVVGPKALDAVEEAPPQATQKSQEAIAQSLSAAEVWVVANLGRVHLPVSQVASFSPGQVVWLEHTQNEPVEVRVEGLLKFNATPMQRNGAVGVQITERL